MSVALPSLPGLEQAQVSNALALELAAGLADTAEILERYNLTVRQFKKVFKDPEFQVMYAQAKIRWGADVNSSERVSTKSTLMVEDSLMKIYSILHDKETTPASALAAFHALVGISDVSPKKQAAVVADNTEKFSITINLSGGAKQFDLTPETKVINSAPALEE